MSSPIRTHLIGSLPFEDARAAMEASLRVLGASLPAVPDGETGERHDFILHLSERLAENPALDAALKQIELGGEPLTLTRLSLRRGRRLAVPLGQIGYHRDWESSRALFHELRERFELPSLRYQMCVAPAANLAAILFGPSAGALRVLGPLRDGLRAEIAAAVATGRDVLTLQLDAALEQIVVANVHRRAPPLARWVARFMARQIVAHVVGVPADVPVGVHLCLGSLRNKRAITPATARPIVLLANAVVAAFAPIRPLDFIHIPIVDTQDPRFYAPLADLRVPSSTRLIAGLVFEDDLALNRERLRLASEALGYTPDVASYCGLGRCSREDGLTRMEHMRALATE